MTNTHSITVVDSQRKSESTDIIIYTIAAIITLCLMLLEKDPIIDPCGKTYKTSASTPIIKTVIAAVLVSSIIGGVFRIIKK